jgi:Flp pilus assembly protein TadD
MKGGLRTSSWLAPFTASFVATVAYLNALDNPFVYDDHRTILENASLLSDDWRIWFWHDVSRPLVNLSYVLDFRLWGGSPFGFHVTNLALHAFTVLLVVRLATALADDLPRGPFRGDVSVRTAGLTAGLLFAVHPLLSSTVGYISARSELLAAAPFLLALLSGRRWLLGGGAGWWVATIFWCIVAALAKETAAALPIVFLAYHRWVLRRLGGRTRGWRLHGALAGLVTLAGAIRLYRFLAIEHPGSPGVHWLAIADELDVAGRYLARLAIPAGQTIAPHVEPAMSLLDFTAMRGLLIGGALLSAGWWLRLRLPAVSLGLAWFLATLAPSAALVAFGHAEGMAEHRVYLASVGLFLMAGVFATTALASLDRASVLLRTVAIAAGVAVVGSLAARTVYRNAVWDSAVSVWAEAAHRSPKGWLAHTGLGEALHDAGRHHEAIGAFSVAIKLKPQDPLGYFKAALCLAESGRFIDAERTIEELRVRQPASPQVTTGLGVVSFFQRDVDGARRRFHQTLERHPRDVFARRWLAALEGELAGNPAEAVRWCHEVRQLEPASRSGHDCLERYRARASAK